MESCATPQYALTFFWAAFVCYSAAFAAYMVYLVAEKKSVNTAATALMAGGFLLQTLAIAFRGAHLHRIPLSNLFEYLSLLAWFTALSYFLVRKLYPKPIFGAFFAPIIFMLIVACSLLPKNMEMQLVPALHSYWLQIHVTLAALGEAAFAVAFVANLMYFFKRMPCCGSKMHQRLPDESSLDLVSYKAIKVGYPLFTVGAMFAGMIWAEQAWGSFWSWDPKEVGSLVVWLVYSAYLHARFIKGWSGMRAAVLSAVGFICTLLTFFANMILSGNHAYN